DAVEADGLLADPAPAGAAIARHEEPEGDAQHRGVRVRRREGELIRLREAAVRARGRRQTERRERDCGKQGPLHRYSMLPGVRLRRRSAWPREDGVEGLQRRVVELRAERADGGIELVHRPWA